MRLSIVGLLCLGLCAELIPTTLAGQPASAGASSRPQESATPVDAAEEAYRRLMELDDAALEEVDRWIQEEEAQRARGTSSGDPTLKARILERLRPVRSAYESFLEKHPDHARCHLAYGSFLGEIGEHDLALEHMEKSKELDPTNPAAWNNLANAYGHRGPVRKSFEYYAKAIELSPQEPVYYQNLAVCVYLFRRDAEEYYALDEAAVFEKALSLYRQAMELSPDDFLLASDYASSFYGMRPPATIDPAVRQAKTLELAERAIPAWEHAMKLASDELQRQGTLIHLARNKLLAGRYAEARVDLRAVTNDVYQSIKSRILKNIETQEDKLSSQAVEEAQTPP